MYEVTMPKLSDSMEDGKIIEWKVKAGDAVREGDVLADIESDKAVLELECYRSGVMSEIRHPNESEVKVGEVIATIEEGAAPKEKAAAPKKEAVATPQMKKAAEPAQAKTAPAATKPSESPQPKEPERPAHVPTGGHAAISPYARKLAQEKGVDFSQVKGSGPNGRIVAEDIERAARERGKERAGADRPVAPQVETVAAPPRPAPPAPSKAAAPKPQPARAPISDGELPPLELEPGEADVEEASYRLRTQARRVTDVKHVVPHFYMTRAIDVSELMNRKDALKSRDGATVTHVIAYACVEALKRHPEVNWSYDHGNVVKWKGVHLGLAVETDQGLTVAVLRDAQNIRTLRELAERATGLVERARSGRLPAEERRHASFTISSMGMWQIEHFEPIINPPSAMTLGVSTALAEAIVRNDELHIGRVMRLTASCDHRMIDGVTTGKFLATLAELLEHPDKMLIAAQSGAMSTSV